MKEYVMRYVGNQLMSDYEISTIQRVGTETERNPSYRAFMKWEWRENTPFNIKRPSAELGSV